MPVKSQERRVKSDGGSAGGGFAAGKSQELAAMPPVKREG